MACGNFTLTKEQALWVLQQIDSAINDEVSGETEWGIPLFDAPHRAFMREVLLDSLNAVLAEGWKA